MSLRVFIAILLTLSLAQLAALGEEGERTGLNGALRQGGMVVGTAAPGATVTLNGVPVRVAVDGRFVIGFGRDQESPAQLRVKYPDNHVEDIELAIVPQAYQIERVNGLPGRTVTVPPEEQARRKCERQMVVEARSFLSDNMDWVGPFRLPAEGRISGRYGSQRILNGEPRSPHYGLDIAGPTGTSVHAPGSGRIVLAEPDFLLEGGLIIIDHGFSVFSALLHLESVEVHVGEQVSLGQRIATMGATGRATGPHVDWRINWGNVRIDPALVAEDYQEGEAE